MSNAAIVLAPQVTIANVSSNTYTSDGNSGSFDATGFRHINVGVDLASASGGSGNIPFYLEGQGPDGVWYSLTSSSVASGGTVLFGFGPETNVSGIGAGMFPPAAIRLRWNLSGEGFTSATFGYWFQGQA